jgi:Flp pilus assembly protein TadG
MRTKHLIRRITKRLGGLRRDQRGNVAIIVGAAIIPLVGALGLATDTARGYLVKARLSQALDTAALAGAKVYYSTARNDDVKKFFAANFPSPSPPVFDTQYQASFMSAKVTLATPVESGAQGSEALKLSATAVIPTTFMRVLGFNNVTVNAVAQAQRGISALDFVISLDMSGSMAGTKITAARDAAISLLDTIWGSNTASPQITIDGITYNLLNAGFVPWNAKVRVQVQTGATTLAAMTPVTTKNVGNFTNPVTGQTQSVVYYAGSTPVPLLMDPRDTSAGGQLPGGWSGCIYARYLGGETDSGSATVPNSDVNDNDADTVRGAVTVGSGVTRKQWLGYEPMAILDAEPQSGSWTRTQAGDTTSPYSRWSESSTWKNKQCYNAYVNDGDSNPGNWGTDTSGNVNFDQPTETYTDSNSNGLYDVGEPYTDSNGNGVNDGGAVKLGSPIGSPHKTSRPSGTGGVPNFKSAPSSTYSGSFRYISVRKPYAVPSNFGTNPGSNDCVPCLSRGIVPLESNKSTIKTILQGITSTSATGNTNLEQGLYWAWEVLMPGEPFDQAVTAVPFPRTRAIIILTDGEQVGGNGDAYKGAFGLDTIAGTTTDSHHGTINVGGVNMANNLDDRARQLALNIKAEGIRLYVIGYDLAGNTHALTFLQDLASPPDQNGVYFFDAPNPSDLAGVFAQIAASLSTLRLSM